MKNFKQFIIQYDGLKPGSHVFQYDINEEFFEELNYPEITKGSFHINLVLDKHSTMLMLNFKIKGYALLTCDRCNQDFDFKIETEQKLIVKFGEQESEESDEIIVISNNRIDFDITQFIYEYIILSIPQRILHEEKDCDPEVLDFLNSSNEEPENRATDPRWDILKRLN